MNAVDKNNNEGLRDNEEVFLKAPQDFDDDFEFSDRTTSFDLEDDDSELDDEFEGLDEDDSDSDFFDGITGLNEPHRPYGRWMNNKQTKSLHSRHRHKEYGWSDDEDDNSW